MSEPRAFTLAREIAPALGDGWTVDDDREPYDWAAFINGPNGATVRIGVDRYGSPESGKVECYAFLPNGSRDVLRYDENGRHVINVSESRGAAVIAREIARRLLPAYLEQLADVNGRIARQNAAATLRAETIESLARDFKGSVASNGHKPNEARFGHGSRDYYGSVEIRHDSKSVDLEIHGLPVDLARKIAAILRKAEA